MNCHSFEDLIIELSRNARMEDTVRQDALEHAGSCAHCTARLESEKKLNTLIRLSKEIPDEAPHYIESALIAAFRRRAQSPGRTLWYRLLQPVQAHRWGIAAAGILVLLALPAYRWLQRVGDTPQPANEPAAVLQSREDPVEAARSYAPEPAAQGSKLESVQGSVPVREAEIATDFISMSGSAGLSTMESGQIVRVLLPRSALVSYGLPVNQDRWEDPIQAQVLLGQDGVAYAIRFMMEADSTPLQPAVHTKQ